MLPSHSGQPGSISPPTGPRVCSLDRKMNETADMSANCHDAIGCRSRGAIGGRIVVKRSAERNSFDNLAFAPGEALLATEDGGDMLHDQLQALDSVWPYDVVDHDTRPRRLIALGRDALATGTDDDDNEPTGLNVTNGSASQFDPQGTVWPSTGTEKSGGHSEGRREQPGGAFRWFVTEQHGINHVFEILQTEHF